MAKLKEIGEKAPDFELKTADGKLFRLSDMLGKSHVVLYFYPKDDTPGCTAQACTFRDQYEDFKDLGAEVVGVSNDKPASHEKFVEKHRLPYTLLSDDGNRVRKLYGVPNKFLFIPGRTTFVIDKTGTIRFVFDSLNKPLEHVEKAKEVLKNLK